MAPTKARPAVEPASYSSEQAATLLGVDKRTMQRWVTAGQIPSFKVGGARRIRRDVLRALMNPSCTVLPRVGDWRDADHYIRLMRPTPERRPVYWNDLAEPAEADDGR